MQELVIALNDIGSGTVSMVKECYVYSGEWQATSFSVLKECPRGPRRGPSSYPPNCPVGLLAPL